MRNDRKAQELLPWYVNGSLDERDMDFMSEAAREPQIASLLRDEIEFAKSFQSEPEGTGALPSAAEGFEQLRVRLDKRPKRLVSSPGRVATMAVLLMAAAAVWFMAPAGSEDRGLYQPMTSGPVAADRAVVQVLLRGDTGAGLEALAAISGARLLGPPSPKGVYRLEAPAEVQPSVFVERLRASEIVDRAEVER